MLGSAGSAAGSAGVESRDDAADAGVDADADADADAGAVASGDEASDAAGDVATSARVRFTESCICVALRGAARRRQRGAGGWDNNPAHVLGLHAVELRLLEEHKVSCADALDLFSRTANSFIDFVRVDSGGEDGAQKEGGGGCGRGVGGDRGGRGGDGRAC